MNNKKPYDILIDLPTDDSIPSDIEIQLLNNIFKENKSFANVVVKEMFMPFIVGILFVVFSLPYTDNIIHSVVLISNGSEIILMAVKVVAIMSLFWLISNLNLARK